MTKFTVLASVAVFTLGAVVGRASAPTPAMASETRVQIVSTYELTLKAGPLATQSFDAI
jgi:hypothetical protein